MPLRFMERLVERSPHGEKIGAGARLALYHPGAGIVDLDFQEDGQVVLRSRHGETVVSAEESADFSRYMHGDIESWLVLSHLAGLRTAFKSSDGELIRIDPTLLLEVGACPIVLRRPSSLEDMNQLLTHDLDEGGFMVCHKMGIVEPITLSILNFIGAPQMNTIDEWFEDAVSRGSLPLLMRIDIALRELERNRLRSSWATQMRGKYIKPALDAALQCS